MRMRTDASGTHTLKARFVRIENQKTVVLVNNEGKERKIALSKLGDQHIYDAVKSDLLRLESIEQAKKAKDVESPFKKC